jgi:hypothetical protein
VDVHDFAGPALDQFAKLILYATRFDSNNERWVKVGNTADTSEFDFESIRRRRYQLGREQFPLAGALLVTSDAGGPNGRRIREWKVEVTNLSAKTGRQFTECHYSPGTSKWSRIKHRMFSYCTMNWGGKPLIRTRTSIGLISTTATTTGLSIQAG